MHRTHPLAERPGGLRLRECADYPLVLPTGDIGGRQLRERFMLRSSIRLRPAGESNSFEFLRGCLYNEQALSFQIAIGAVTDRGELVAKEIEDRGFPRGTLSLACLRARQLPVAAHAFVRHLMQAMGEGAPGA